MVLGPSVSGESTVGASSPLSSLVCRDTQDAECPCGEDWPWHAPVDEAQALPLTQVCQVHPYCPHPVAPRALCLYSSNQQYKSPASTNGSPAL